MSAVFDVLENHAIFGGIGVALVAIIGALLAYVRHLDGRASKAEEQRKVAEMKLEIKDRARDELVKRFSAREKELNEVAKRVAIDAINQVTDQAIASGPTTTIDWEKESTDILNEAISSAHADAFGSGKMPPE